MKKKKCTSSLRRHPACACDPVDYGSLSSEISSGSGSILLSHTSSYGSSSGTSGCDPGAFLIQRELLSRLIVKAFRDITGVHNKTSLEKLVQDLSNRPSTFGVGVMMFDLNNLKYVNDTYGHEKGDEFIQTFTYCLTRILDSDSFLARYGGDEFILIQQNTSLSELQHMAEKLDSLVQEYNTRTTLPLSYAIGYEVSFQNHYFMMEDLINAADKKMYQDKASRKIAAIRELALPPIPAIR